MGNLQKPFWMDSAIGVVALMLTVVSTLGLIGVEFFSVDAVAYIALGVGLFILILAVVFRPRHSLKQLSRGNVPSVIGALKTSAQELLIVNPSGLDDLSGDLLELVEEQALEVSIIGSAPEIQEVVGALEATKRNGLFEGVRVTGFPGDQTILCFVNKGRKALTLLVIVEDKCFRVKIRDEIVVELLVRLLKKEAQNSPKHIRLTEAASPKAVLDTINNQQRRYLESFDMLRTGSVSFYGEEVKIIQSGWVESGEFNTIHTLDITTSPKLLLRRKRYLQANKGFLAKEGREIRRVFMLEAATVEDPEERAALKELMTMQAGFGVQVGLLLIEDLPIDLRRDFILYDDKIALVEERQANVEYTLGKSTAYFSKDIIARYRATFERVWSGEITGTRPDERARKFLETDQV